MQVPEQRRRVVVVVPTHNERDNIPLLIAALRALALDLAIVITDDRSQDRTAEVVRSLDGFGRDVFLIERQTARSFASSCIDGFRFALAMDAAIVVQMDADLSHRAVDLPALIRALECADVAVGSRYVADGRVDGWNTLRLVVSSVGNWYARALTGMPIRDLTSGFKAYRACAARQLVSATIRTRGYVFQVETLWQLYRRCMRIAEVPITYTRRRLGRSKFRIAMVLEAFFGDPVVEALGG